MILSLYKQSHFRSGFDPPTGVGLNARLRASDFLQCKCRTFLLITQIILEKNHFPSHILTFRFLFGTAPILSKTQAASSRRCFTEAIQPPPSYKLSAKDHQKDTAYSSKVV